MPKILIIDDSDYMRDFTKKILLENGFQVIEAINGDLGIETTDRENPDCILLDLLMPQVDGYEVLRRLRQLRNTIPILIYSSDLQDNAKSHSFELGAFDFIDKPPNRQILIQKIKTALTLNQQGGSLALTDKQNDVLKEMINIGIGKGAEMLNAILATHINLEVPFVRVLSQKEFECDVKKNQVDSLAAVNLAFNGDITGNVELVFPKESAANLVAALTGEKPETIIMDSIRTGTLSEIGNVVINAVIGSISNLLGFTLNYSTPSYIEGNYEKLSMAVRTGKDSIILQARARFIIDTLAVVGDIMLFLELDSLDKIFSIIKRVENDEN
jgi:chemotaxis protein CheC